MIDFTPNPLNMPVTPVKLPTVAADAKEAELHKIAHDFASVFLSEFVSIMLEESKPEEDEFSNEISRTLMSQAMGEELANSGTGQQLSDSLLSTLIKMRSVSEEGSHGLEPTTSHND